MTDQIARPDAPVSSPDLPFTALVRDLPATTPFVGPEELERASGRGFHLRLGANESGFGPSPRALEAMRDALSHVAWYADPQAYDLRSAIARSLNTTWERVMVGAGIDDLLGVCVRLFLEPGDYAVASLGAYPTVGFHLAGYGARTERPPYRDQRNDLDALSEAARRVGAKLVYLSNPDNPTGSWLRGDDIRAFIETLPPGCMFLLDEAYIEFAPDEAQTILAGDDPRVIRLRTFSKAYGMAGARIAYLVAAPEVIAAFDKVRLHFGVNRVAQEGALAALADVAYLERVVAEVARGRADYAALAGEFGLPALPSATNFVAMDVGGAERARAAVAALAAAGVFIRMPGAPGLDRLIRVTVGTPEQRRAFADIFRQVWPRLT